jgi:hypothetical protein
VNCSQLFIGFDKKIDETRSEVFSITLVPSASPDAKKVRAVLGSNFIYYLSPHTGCGCGWDFLDVGTPSDELSRQSCDALGRFLSSIERLKQSGKLYSVCIDSLGTSPRAETTISASDFMSKIGSLRIGYSSGGAKVFVIGT